MASIDLSQDILERLYCPEESDMRCSNSFSISLDNEAPRLRHEAALS